MAVVAHATPFARADRFEASPAASDPPLVKWLIIGISLAFFVTFLLLPLLAVFIEAFKKGWEAYFKAIVEPDTLASIRLTLLAAAIAVPLNVIFGVFASNVACLSSHVRGLNRFSGYGWNATCQSKSPSALVSAFNLSTRTLPGSARLGLASGLAVQWWSIDT